MQILYFPPFPVCPSIYGSRVAVSCLPVQRRRPVNFPSFSLVVPMYWSTISALRLSSVLGTRNLLDRLSLHCWDLEYVNSLFLIFVKKQSQELTRVNPDRNIFSINVELTSTFLLYRGLVHHHHRILNVSTDSLTP